MEAFLDGEIIVAFLTLAALEIVLGIDNIIFLSIMAAKLPVALQARARTIGLAGAMLTRIALLVSVAWLARLTSTLFTILGNQISGRDLILIGGGAFLIYKAGKEIIEQANEGYDGKASTDGKRKQIGFVSVVLQIMVLDIVFSLDSVITAVGMTTTLPQHMAVPVMIAAIVVAIIVMMFFSGSVSRFVENNPGIKTLALAFLVLIGAVLIIDGLDYHVPKAYVYVAMAFSLAVELLNMWIRKKAAARAK
jgi:predicted tellurium resistance membrane protein TerC